MSRKYFLKDPLHPEGGFHINVKREKDCVFCDHCTDIFWDYTNLIYGIVCSEDHDINAEDCQYFREDGEDESGEDE